MSQKYIISISYHTKLAFDDKETAMRAYMLLTESTPIASASCYPDKAPESLKHVDYVRDSDIEIELSRKDAKSFALHWTQEEFKQKCKPQPTEIDGDARLITEETVHAIAGPSNNDDNVDADFDL